jgi:hypothetical protein
MPSPKLTRSYRSVHPPPHQCLLHPQSADAITQADAQLPFSASAAVPMSVVSVGSKLTAFRASRGTPCWASCIAATLKKPTLLQAHARETEQALVTRISERKVSLESFACEKLVRYSDLIVDKLCRRLRPELQIFKAGVSDG